METILERIISVKHSELQAVEKMLKEQACSKQRKIPFLKKLLAADEVSIIAEFKRASPSKGVINTALDPKKQARSYAEFGADAISVLTDQTFFKGSFADLAAVREAVNVPILCKDFIVDKIQIDLAEAAGADIILLIVAALEKQRLFELYEYAIQKGFEVLIEVHNEGEAEIALETGSKLIGINNRDLKTFEVKMETTEKLAPVLVKSGALVISESGMKNSEDVLRATRAGAKGILVGETLMASGNLEHTFQQIRMPVERMGSK